jgi:isopenicillin N synthase-like dioxygenase
MIEQGFFVGPELPADAQPPFRDFCLPNKWPSESLIRPGKFKTPLIDYQARLSALCLKLMQILAEGLPYCNAHTFDAFSTDPIANVRLLHYPPQPNLDDKNQLGAGAHTDFGAITLLLQDAKGGLQVLNQSTNEWIDVPPNPDAYVVNVGDMLDMWTKSEYRSNIHRVINRSGAHRYSVPFFFDGNVDYVLGPLDGSESSDGGQTVEQFMKERYMRTNVT